MSTATITSKGQITIPAIVRNTLGVEAIVRVAAALATPEAPANAPASGKHSPSLNTLRKYAAALGKRVEVHLS